MQAYVNRQSMIITKLFGKDIDFGKIFKAASWEFWMLLSVKVHIKPVRSFDLKTQPNDILPLLFRDVDQKSTTTREKSKQMRTSPTKK